MRVPAQVIEVTVASFRTFCVFAVCLICSALLILAPIYLAFQLFPGESNLWLALVPRDLSSLPAVLSSWWLHYDVGHLRRNTQSALVLLPMVALSFADVSSLRTLLRTTRFGAFRYGGAAVLLRTLCIPMLATVFAVLALGILTSSLTWLAGPTVIRTATETFTVRCCMGFSDVVNSLGGWLLAIALLTLRFRNTSWWFITGAATCVLVSLPEEIRGFAAIAVPRATGGFTDHGGHLIGFAAGMLLAVIWNRCLPHTLLPMCTAPLRGSLMSAANKG